MIIGQFCGAGAAGGWRGGERRRAAFGRPSPNHAAALRRERARVRGEETEGGRDEREAKRGEERHRETERGRMGDGF